MRPVEWLCQTADSANKSWPNLGFPFCLTFFYCSPPIAGRRNKTASPNMTTAMPSHFGTHRVIRTLAAVIQENQETPDFEATPMTLKPHESKLLKVSQPRSLRSKSELRVGS